MRGLVCSFVAFCLFTAAILGTDTATPPKTVMVLPGKALLQDDLHTGKSTGWLSKKGKWTVVDGALRGEELASDMHGAVKRHPLAFHNSVIQYAFKLDGTKQTTLSLNSATGHACRVIIRPTGIIVQKDKDKQTGAKGVQLDSYEAPIKPGVWHQLVVEILNRNMLVRLDGDNVAFGAHDGINVSMVNLGITVQGASASFKDLQVWEATANPAFDLAKIKTLSKRKQ